MKKNNVRFVFLNKNKMDKITYQESWSEILAWISDISSSRLFSH